MASVWHKYYALAGTDRSWDRWCKKLSKMNYEQYIVQVKMNYEQYIVQVSPRAIEFSGQTAVGDMCIVFNCDRMISLV
jgi:hypothetical protein